MKVLITGASGFIGRHVLAQLADTGAEVIAVARHRGQGLDQVEWRQSDLLEPGSAASLFRTSRPTHLIHLAWNVTPAQFWSAGDNMKWATATLQLFRAFAESGGVGAMIAGTCAEYSWDKARLAESDICIPDSLYGRAKDSARVAVLSAADEMGVACAWGRVFWLYGPHEPRGRLVSDVAAALVQGKNIACSDGDQKRDFLHVADVAAALVAALSQGWRGPLNIGSGQAVAVRDILVMLGELSGRPDLIQLGARPTPTNGRPEVVADISLLKNIIKSQPHFSLRSGLAQTLNWWSSQRL